jgi:hypothetical protein
MTPSQRQLARHALGLPNSARESYRNRYVTAPGTDIWADWQAMVRAGQATYDPTPPGTFRLTRAGALMAIEPGEALDREDFPQPS